MDIDVLHVIAKGMLYKEISSDGRYYYKTGFRTLYGDFEVFSVYSERIAYELGCALGIDVLKQDLVYLPFEKSEVLACRSENFLEAEESIATFKFLGIHKYSDIQDRFPDYLKYFNTVLIFDYIINNIDRHLNNIALIMCEDGTFRTPPIFDNGSSMFFDLNNEELEYIVNNKYAMNKYDVAKPFSSKHKSQIKYVEDSGVYPDLNFDFDIREIVSKYFDGVRCEAIVTLLERRLSYVRQFIENR